MGSQVFILFYGLKPNTIFILRLTCPQFGLLELFQIGTCVPLTNPPLFFEYFLTFCHHKSFQAPSVYFSPCAWNRPLLQGALVPFIGEWVFRNQDPSTMFITTEASLLLGPLKNRARRYTYVWQYPRAHNYIYLYI